MNFYLSQEMVEMIQREQRKAATFALRDAMITAGCVIDMATACNIVKAVAGGCFSPVSIHGKRMLRVSI